MSKNVISSADAELLIHRFITERIELFAMFVSADGSLQAQLTGFLVGSTAEHGLVLATAFGESPLGAIIFYNERVRGSSCEYFDETNLPVDFEFGSVLRILMPNGDSLTLLEIREHDKSE